LTRQLHGGDWMPNRLRRLVMALERRSIVETASINGDRYCFSEPSEKPRTEFAVRFRKVERPSAFREA
jgi:hypothetical protein